ncbi:kinase-like domain-containing protein [Melampsora americana]|nr:kinase-like domain-containing protein [Melampsora americana]
MPFIHHHYIQILRPSKTVKETLDAHLYRSHDGYRQVNQYILKHDLGRGSFGAVRLAVDAQTGLEYAVKEFSKKRLRRKFGNVLCVGDNGGDEDALHLIRNEVAIMKKVQHPNIVKLYEVLDVEGEDSLYMVMEYCRGGRLESGIQDHGLIRRYFRQLMIGIDYLHQNEIIHHDIKPDNILLSSDRKQIKIVDFGISALFESSQQQRLMGSPAFLSPEIITGQSSGGTESDIWAMGVTLYCMIEGKLPFGEKGEALDLYHDIQEVAPDIPETWDPRLIDLIAKMLDKDPTSRIKLPEMSQHPWITDTGKLSNVTLIENQQEGIYKINKNHSEFELRECLKDRVH